MHAMLCFASGNCWKSMEEDLNKGHMKKDIPLIVSALSLRPTLQRLTCIKASCVDARENLRTPSCCWQRCTMLNTETSHAQQLKQQIYSLWSSILISESLPLLTLV